MTKALASTRLPGLITCLAAAWELIPSFGSLPVEVGPLV